MQNGTTLFVSSANFKYSSGLYSTAFNVLRFGISSNDILRVVLANGASRGTAASVLILDRTVLPVNLCEFLKYISSAETLRRRLLRLPLVALFVGGLVMSAFWPNEAELGELMGVVTMAFFFINSDMPT